MPGRAACWIDAFADRWQKKALLLAADQPGKVCGRQRGGGGWTAAEHGDDPRGERGERGGQERGTTHTTSRKHEECSEIAIRSSSYDVRQYPASRSRRSVAIGPDRAH
jgi:hypothetical protein